MVTEKYDVIIIGAGYAGLASAVSLLEDKYKVLVVEPEPGLSQYTYYAGLDAKVYVDEDVIDFLSKNHVIVNRDDRGLWVRPIEYIVRLSSKVFDLGGDIIVNTDLEPLFTPSEQGITISGVILRDANEHMMEDRGIIGSKAVIDTTPGGYLAGMILDRLKIGVMTEGLGPTIPGSRELVDRTYWLIPGFIVAGLSVSVIHGCSQPWPYVSPLILSGLRAAELIKTGRGGVVSSPLPPNVI